MSRKPTSQKFTIPDESYSSKTKPRRLSLRAKLLIALLLLFLTSWTIIFTLETRSVKSEPETSSEKPNSWRDDEKAEKVKEMMIHAWSGYYSTSKHCDEVSPVSGTCHNWDNHPSSLALSAIDSLDTLWLMGLRNEFKQAVSIVEKVGWNQDVSVSFFEMVIRGVGGLLAAYDLTLDHFFLEKCLDLAERLLVAFDEGLDGGLPWSRIHLKTGQRGDNPFLSGNMYIAEVATLQLEFEYLSLVSGDERYAKKARWINAWLAKKRTEIPVRGVWPRDLTKNGELIGSHYTIGAGLDSFMEYLVKLWVWQGRPSTPPEYDETPLREMYDEAVDAVIEHLGTETRLGNETFRYFSNANLNGKVFHPDGTLEHLACFAGGTMALGVHSWSGWSRDVTPDKLESHKLEVWKQKRIAKWAEWNTMSCAKTYSDSPIGLGPERSSMTSSPIRPARISTFVRVYLLRPETIESLFYLWRFTHDQVYRDEIWKIVLALDAECRVAHGFSGVQDVGVDSGQKRYTNVQESYFLAETLKYAWLAFEDDQVLDLDRVVFNTGTFEVDLG
jgi:mannosyl-oligosaccharide alpha-1,2-mannosidase